MSTNNQANNRTNFITSAMFATVGLVMASVLGVFHAKVDLYPTLSFKTPPPYSISEQGIFFKTYNVHLDQEVKDPDLYNSFKELLENANSLDTIRIHLGGPGGEVLTMLELYNEVKHSSATIVMVVDGPTYSADSFLALAGDKLEIGTGAMFMFHDVQVPPLALIDRGTIAFINAAHEAMNEVLSPYLTKEQLAYIYADPDNQVYFTGPQMKALWDKAHGR